jgi:hypothetical protein
MVLVQTFVAVRLRAPRYFRRLLFPARQRIIDMLVYTVNRVMLARFRLPARVNMMRMVAAGPVMVRVEVRMTLLPVVLGKVDESVTQCFMLLVSVLGMRGVKSAVAVVVKLMNGGIAIRLAHCLLGIGLHLNAASRL